jgi:hypothetical protein
VNQVRTVILAALAAVVSVLAGEAAHSVAESVATFVIAGTAALVAYGQLPPKKISTALTTVLYSNVRLLTSPRPAQIVGDCAHSARS